MGTRNDTTPSTVRTDAVSPDSQPEPNDAGTLAAFERKIRREGAEARRRFRQHVAIAFIFGLVALTLVLIVRLNPH